MPPRQTGAENEQAGVSATVLGRGPLVSPEKKENRAFEAW